MISNPEYFELVSNILITQKLFHPVIFTDCNLITYKLSELQDPDILPICQYYYAGIKRYIINETEYSTVDVNKSALYKTTVKLSDDNIISNQLFNEVMCWLGRDIKTHYDSKKQIINTIDRASNDMYTVCIYKIKQPC